MFLLSVHVQNTSLSQPSTDLYISFDYDFRLYTVHKPLIQVCSRRVKNTPVDVNGTPLFSGLDVHTGWSEVLGPVAYLPQKCWLGPHIFKRLTLL